jgi:hypothetical protein
MKGISFPRTAYCLLRSKGVGLGRTLRLPGNLRQEVLWHGERKD